MAQEYFVLMPDLGEGVLEGELKSWKIAVGDQVSEDDIAAEVLTDKASMEIPSTAKGRVKELKIKAGESCPVGGVLFVVEGSGPAPVKKAPEAKTPEREDKAEQTAKEKAAEKVAPLEGVLSAPIVKKWARDHGVDLSKVKGTGLSGRITLDDVQRLKPPEIKPQSLKQPPPPQGISGREERVKLRGIRKKIAENMQASKRTIPHFTVGDEAWAANLVQLREQAKKLYPEEKITYLAMIMKILQTHLKEFPAFNASIDESTEEIVYKKYYHFGFAADTPRGLLVPVIKNVDQKNILSISREIKTLSQKARDGSIALDEMKGATITISNMGSIGGQWATPIINPPESAILGMYRMRQDPFFDGEKFRLAPRMGFSITADHRIIDGASSARFISQFVERVENPSLILLEN